MPVRVGAGAPTLLLDMENARHEASRSGRFAWVQSTHSTTLPSV